MFALYLRENFSTAEVRMVASCYNVLLEFCKLSGLQQHGVL